MPASDPVTEAFLEIYFARPLAKKFTKRFGAKFLRFWKPSQHAESYVGFDQGWVRHKGATPAEFEETLRQAIKNNATTVKKFFVGYFLQFKRVHHLTRRTKYTADSIAGEHLRVDIDLVPNATTGLSQHETLVRLSRITRTTVHYACGMIFSADAIYEAPRLEQLRLVQVDSLVERASRHWKPEERHFIQFQNPAATPVWCSESFPGKVLSAKVWASEQKSMNGGQVLELLDEARDELALPKEKPVPFLTIFEFESRQ